MLISVDTGNKSIKTTHKLFTSGLTISDTKPPFGENILYYEGKYYVLSEQRIPYLRDKTIDDRFFVLTLFAIYFELEYNHILPISSVAEIQLAISLPPLHYGAQYKKFEEYFCGRDIIDFKMNGRPHSLFINKAVCFPQAYAAAMTVFQTIRDQTKVRIVDIGGFTADYLQIVNGQADLTVCDSLEHGVITLYNEIIRKVNADLDMLVDDTDIDEVINGRSDAYPKQVVAIVHNKALEFVDTLNMKLRERMVDLRLGKTIFAGGGAVLLRRYIENSGKFGNCSFITDVRANAKGSEILYTVNQGR